MHIFLQGERNIGKSTIISKTLGLLMAGGGIELCGFLTWKGGEDDPHVYMRNAARPDEGEITRIAVFDEKTGRMRPDVSAFNGAGADALKDRPGARLIIMDELGMLESGAHRFKQSVFEALERKIPVLGVLRLGDIPWLRPIRDSGSTTIYKVNEKNRDALPGEIAEELSQIIGKPR